MTPETMSRLRRCMDGRLRIGRFTGIGILSTIRDMRDGTLPRDEGRAYLRKRYLLTDEDISELESEP